MWKKFGEMLLRLIEEGNVDPAYIGILGGLSPAFLLKINGCLNLSVDE